MRVITADHIVPTYDKNHPPRAQIDFGEVFAVDTHDRIPGLSTPEAFERGVETMELCAVTGPIAFKGIQPGEMLRVDILDIAVADRGVICTIPQSSAFAEKIGAYQAKVVEIKDSMICFSDTIRVPINPHVGRVATMPDGDALHTINPGPYGGNIDNKHITRGSSVFLPVFVEDALLTIGDLHAAMGDGESNSSGVETMGRVTLRCSRVPELQLSQPLVVTDTEVQLLGQGETLDEASHLTLDLMAELLSDELGLDYGEAAMLISIAGDLQVCQIVNPLSGVRVSLSRELFAERPWMRGSEEWGSEKK